ncbi:MAG: response regulator [Gemmatimonadetes bacterium]|nr:MAG: response regulator [Gemmatimonadota bacterium]
MVFNTLVVDDSAVMRKMIIRTLHLSGVPLGEVYEAGNGQEALDVMADHWVDLALVDINMPVMNGEEFIQRVRADDETRDLAIIVVSTESSETRINQIRAAGADFVHKPFTPEQLRDTVLRVTGVSDGEPHDMEAAGGGGFDF